jgi:hypothetical protein
MNWSVTVYAAILFFVLTPAVLVRLPPKGSKFTVAAVHAVIFALIFHFTHKLVWQLSMGMGMPRPVRKEGMEEGPNGEQAPVKEEEKEKKDE